MATIFSQDALNQSQSQGDRAIATPVFTAEKPSLIGKTLDELRVLMSELGEPKFRAEQLHHWLYVKNVRDWEAMGNLKRDFRDKLKANFRIGPLEIASKQESKDGTVKYLFRLDDGQLIESVLMYFQDRDTYAVCVSTQVGCAVNCSFCATAKLGFKRQLSIAEIVDQYVYVQGDSGKEVRNLVFMGQGEPLLNYDNLLPAIHILNQSAEVGMRHITISTSGIVPQIDRLADEKLQLTLAVSLHAPNDTVRESFMPINRKWPVAELIVSLKRYVAKTNRRLTIEYILLEGVNDNPQEAHQLGQLLKGLKCNVNLIPYNPISHCSEFKRPSRNRVFAFNEIVTSYGKKVTVRVERGADIDAACGQLANKMQD
ncbi:MAG: 23S rRNA (adenine(2503)-C(2))-methyltransferase RlmN [Vampirovibrionales bacterium]|nr:23S rRNA (adenine(2503)-C(2))-methyltransferase RlmN [Vampirovibrionales bacterium]